MAEQNNNNNAKIESIVVSDVNNMSKDKIKTKPVINEAIVSGNTDPKKLYFWQSWSKKRKIIVIISSVAAILVVCLVIVEINLYKNESKTPQTVSQKLNSINNEADDLAANNNKSEALANYDKAIAQSKDEQYTANLYMQKATFALNNNLLKDALKAAIKADEILNIEVSSKLVATIYEKMENKSEAAKYYRKAGSLAGNSSSGESKQYYIDKAISLGG